MQKSKAIFLINANTDNQTRLGSLRKKSYRHSSKANIDNFQFYFILNNVVVVLSLVFEKEKLSNSDIKNKMNKLTNESKSMLPISKSISNSILNIKSKNNSSRTNSLTSSARVKILKLPNASGGGGGLRFEDPRYKAAKLKKQRKQDIQRRFNDLGQNVANKNSSKRSAEQNSELQNNYRVAHCHMTFIFDPNGRFSYWMGMFTLKIQNNIYFLKSSFFLLS